LDKTLNSFRHFKRGSTLPSQETGGLVTVPNIIVFDGRTVNARVQEVESSNPGPARSYTALQTVRHCFNIYATAVLPCHDAEMGTANTLRRV